MGTCNFYNKNADSIYACMVQDDFEYQDIQHRLYYELKRIFTNAIGSDKRFDSDYSGLTIITLDFSKDYLNCPSAYYNQVGVEVYISYEIGIRSGYYEGINFDFERNITIEGVDFDLEDVVEQKLSIYPNRYAKWLSSWVQSTCSKSNKQINAVFKQLAHYNLDTLGVFSNGEAIYVKKSA